MLVDDAAAAYPSLTQLTQPTNLSVDRDGSPSSCILNQNRSSPGSAGEAAEV
jgi:hypothetical protein